MITTTTTSTTPNILLALGMACLLSPVTQAWVVNPAGRRQIHPTTTTTASTTTTTTPLAPVTLLGGRPVSYHPQTKRVGVPTALHLYDDDEEEDEDDDEDDDRSTAATSKNPYADPNYPDLEFVDYSDPNYVVDYGDGENLVYYDPSTGEAEPKEPADEEILAQWREDRQRRNDEFQFQSYYSNVLKDGDVYKGEWTVYRTSTFAPKAADATDATTSSDSSSSSSDGSSSSTTVMPRLIQTLEPLKVVSQARKIVLDPKTEGAIPPGLDPTKFPTELERILHTERLATEQEAAEDPLKVWQDDIDTDSGFGQHDDDDSRSSSSSSKSAADEAWDRFSEEMVRYTYWPEQLAARDFRGPQGIMVVGNAHTISTTVPLKAQNDDDDTTPQQDPEGPYAEYRTEIGLQSKQLRYRIKLDYAVLEKEQSEAYPPLHLRTFIVCRETREAWPRRRQTSNTNSRTLADYMAASEALFGVPGADNGLYDPPPVGSDEQASQYMMLDLDGRATALFPFKMDQDPKAFNGFGWVMSLDWTPGSMRYQVDRKIRGGPDILCLRTLELSEVQSVDAETYRPRDGGRDMRQ